jgi:hypothetical protein
MGVDSLQAREVKLFQTRDYTRSVNIPYTYRFTPSEIDEIVNIVESEISRVL